MPEIAPKKKFGQNFLNDNSIAVQIVDFLCTEKTNNIIEVGPGMGILTKEILKIDDLNKKFIELTTCIRFHCCFSSCSCNSIRDQTNFSLKCFNSLSGV